MKKTDTLVDLLLSDIEKKEVLEVACGAADFSVSAARVANHVSCIDLDDCRTNDLNKRKNVTFQIMDAAQMSYPDNTFDTIVIYNAIFHIRKQWDEIVKECKRVLKRTGILYVIGTWKLDTSLMIDMFDEQAFWEDDYLFVRIEKEQADPGLSV